MLKEDDKRNSGWSCKLWVKHGLLGRWTVVLLHGNLAGSQKRGVKRYGGLRSIMHAALSSNILNDTGATLRFNLNTHRHRDVFPI